MTFKLLFLGGSDIQIPAIRRAKQIGYEIILCDYLPTNPGRTVCDKYYDVSTTDFEGILEVARTENIDGIIAYASDPAAATAAFVSEKMNLPGKPLSGVQTLTNKYQFRSLLKTRGYRCPTFAKVEGPLDCIAFVGKHGKSIIKPLDSCGSKGIRVVDKHTDFGDAFSISKSFSREGGVIIEKFIEKKGFQMSGDVLIIEGKVAFSKYGDVHFDAQCNSIVPCSITVPSTHSPSVHSAIDDICERIFEDLKIRCGTFNVDVLVGDDDGIYIIEIGARNGGNLLTEVISMQSGYDLAGITLRNAMRHPTIGEALRSENWSEGAPACAHYVIHAEKDATLDNIIYSEEIEKNIVYQYLAIKHGAEVKMFDGSNKRVGVCLLRFDSPTEMRDKIINMKDHIILKYKR